jgi:hypothetical protein
VGKCVGDTSGYVCCVVCTVAIAQTMIFGLWHRVLLYADMEILEEQGQHVLSKYHYQPIRLHGVITIWASGYHTTAEATGPDDGSSKQCADFYGIRGTQPFLNNKRSVLKRMEHCFLLFTNAKQVQLLFLTSLPPSLITPSLSECWLWDRESI